MVMEPNDCCRFCEKNMRIAGVLTHSSSIFEKQKKPQSIAERLLHVGVAVVKTPAKSNRICQRCLTLLSRLERDLPVYWRWVEDEENEEASAVETMTGRSGKRDREREPTPSKTPRALKKFCHNPASPGTANIRRSITGEDVKAGCAAELRLKEEESIPTSRYPSVKSETGTADSSCRILPPVRHVASQTDPSKKTFDTHLSMQTLQNQFRSKATQVKMPSRDCGVGTVTFPLDSPLLLLQPTLVKRPSKRPRLSLTDEEEGPSESSSSVAVHEPEDSNMTLWTQSLSWVK
ncbi:hypothetical protein PFLUV_G00082470 [Perca fluviatilis]|uniref:Uncharacterized protein n=1 Tax=Perca fluviatilis TaxID=8168 RepID=A0A6A5EEL5_PERFL|nr:uncharacterized protein LOC120562788 [Perca fluviatilis]KAF1387681.1 hypothetical protein PFLUV_G00082470 [Perca fluviatilis]